MHDIVHDFALFLSDGECLAIEVNSGDDDLFINSSNKNVRHLMLKVNKEVPFPMSICSVKSLRSLVIKYSHSLSSDVYLKLCELTYLRALKFTANFYDQEVMEIPKEIGKLIHLRYLDFGRQNITKLPESLCELYNLHTLDIDGSMVSELPCGIEKLVNLRCLKNTTSSLLYIPKGIEKLTGLQTLSEFVVSGGGDDDSKACSLEGIKNLNNLEGSLQIRGLGNVTNVSEGKMKEALKNKKYITDLKLQFDKGTKDVARGSVYWKGFEEGDSCEDYEVVLEALQPPPELERLSIKYYAGRTFPSTWKASLTKLKSLFLESCVNCKNLHALGELPSLEGLCIGWMRNVKKVDNEFWGIESGASSSSSSSALFPKLKTLELWGLGEWEEWTYENTKKGEKEEHIRFMPCLATLEIIDCYRLKALADSLLQRTTLKKLEICGCPILKKRYEGGRGFEKFDPNPVFRGAMTFLVLLMSDMRNQVIGDWLSV
ncbi:putative disease resistance protein At3g14460 [Pistacia vera]|uniref:putative disease resistance protein At3g14460 n=1 Tax=Pistacia vera TaxID=55513 RepID=UPI0012633D31|nr:putative disease resistance protein At3g14460 [Pistacia vera]